MFGVQSDKATGLLRINSYIIIMIIRSDKAIIIQFPPVQACHPPITLPCYLLFYSQ